MRKDDSQFTINVIYDESRLEFIATFDNYDGSPDGGHTYGAGDNKALAMINLLENAKSWETEDEYYNFKNK